MGKGRQELRVRRPEWQGNTRGSFRWQKSAHHLPLHVRSGVAGGLPAVLVQYGSYLRPPRASRATRRDVGGDFAGTPIENRNLQGAHGLAFQVGVLVQQRLQLRLPSVI